MFQITGVIAALLFLVAVLVLVRRGKLRIDQSLWWIIATLGILAMAAAPGILEWAADLAGVEVPSNLLFAAALYLLSGLLLIQQVQISTLRERQRIIAQTLAQTTAVDLGRE